MGNIDVEEEHEFEYKEEGYFCTKCKSICALYEQGLSCNCDNRWETERVYEEDHPLTWTKVNISVQLV